MAELWRNGAMDLVVPLRMSRVLPTPLPYAGSVIRGYALVGLRMRDTSPLLPAAVRKLLVGLAWFTRGGSSTLSFTRNVERNTPRPLSHVPEQRMTVLNF